MCNKLELYQFPSDIAKLRRLEKTIIAKRLLFKKIAIMPKGQPPKLKESICNLPLDIETVCDILPRGPHSNGIIMVKLKRKLAYSGRLLFEPVCPSVVISALQYLKQLNHLYTDI